VPEEAGEVLMILKSRNPKKMPYGVEKTDMKRGTTT
jgi:hypothetical protein